VNRRAILLTTIAMIGGVVTGCHASGSEQSEVQRWSGVVKDVRVQWTAEQGIDLVNGPAVPLRAYVESRSLAQSMGNLDYAYPGFEEAVKPNTDDGTGVGTDSRRPNTDGKVPVNLVGNEQNRILSLDRRGQAVVATYCQYTYTLAHQLVGDNYEAAQAGVGESRGIYVQRVVLDEPPTGHSSLPPQRGPEPAPSRDVFGGWKVSRFLSSFDVKQPDFGVVWPTYDADLASCVAKAPDPPERRAFLIDGEHPRSDFPTSPPSPGWPAGGEP
jgi:hypothetical protein